MTQLTTKQKGGIAIAVLVAIALTALVLLWPRKSAASTSDDLVDDGGGENKTPTPIGTTPGTPAISMGPDPYHPKTTPTQGEYYIPRAGDGDNLICSKAGLSPVVRAQGVLRDHALNDWIAKTTRPGATAKQLDLDWGYAHMVGFELQDWTWKTQHVGSGGRAICIVYVPTQKEVDAA